MLKGWIIYSQADADKNQAFISRFFDKQEAYQMHFELLYKEQLSIGFTVAFSIQKNGQSKPLPDFVIMRAIDPVLSGFFEAARVPVFNSAQTSRMSNHKFLTHLALKKLQIPMLPTFCLTGTQLLHADALPLPYPFVCKKCEGRGGQEVFLIHNAGELSIIPSLRGDAHWLVQALAPVSGQDLRVFVIGKQIIGAILRVNAHDFRANFSLSQTASWYELKPNQIQLIERIIHAFDFDFVGIDFLFDQDGSLIFNEIEDVVGSRTLSIYSDVDVVDLYLQYIQKKCYRNL